MKKHLDMMGNGKNRLLKLIYSASLITLLAVTSASAVTSVFAFAQASSLVRLGDVSVATLAPASIKLGLKDSTSGDITYYDQLTNSILKDHFASTYTQSTDDTVSLTRGYYPVSSSFKSRWLVKGSDGTYDALMPKFTAEYGNNNFTENNVDSPSFFPGYASEKHYLSMEIYIHQDKTASLPVIMYLDKSTSLSADSSKNAAMVSAMKGKLNLSQTELDKIIYSLRISILTSDNYYILDPFKEETTYLAGRLNAIGGDDYYDTYGVGFSSGNYSSKEALFGEYSGFDKIVWDAPLTTDSTVSGTVTAFNAKTQAGNSPLNIEQSVANGVKLTEEDSFLLTDFAYSSARSTNYPLAKLHPGETKRIVVSYYIEGWDLDNIDAVQYASFLSAFKLTGFYDYSGIYSSLS
ncbi:MAG: hypothetical protein LKJ88_05825 [Bacilli bacterium]|jgi:hypothetical protein|nr:hypothetical protein [Bacilli bacterium]